jgi:hypothetical protein
MAVHLERDAQSFVGNTVLAACGLYQGYLVETTMELKRNTITVAQVARFTSSMRTGSLEVESGGYRSRSKVGANDHTK